VLAAGALAVALLRSGEAEAAQSLAYDTLQRCRRVFGPEHPMTLYVTEAASIGHPIPGSDAPGDRPDRPL
jgi:hypothetical protein